MNEGTGECVSSGGAGGRRRTDVTGVVFYALLLPWALSLASSFVLHGRHDLWPVLVGLILFQACNYLVHSRSTAFFPRLAPSSLHVFTNTAVSLIHSSIVGLSVAGILMYTWCQKGLPSMFQHEELFSGVWPGAQVILCFSLGYFVYDQVDMLCSHLYNPWAPSLLVHHAVLLVCFTMAIYRQITINYLILTLFCELHSIFLHVRRVLRMAGVRKEGSWLVKIEWSLNWITFFTSRIGTHAYITYKLILDASKFPLGVEWPLAIAGMIGLNILNVNLGFEMFGAFKKERVVWRKQVKAM